MQGWGLTFPAAPELDLPQHPGSRLPRQEPRPPRVAGCRCLDAWLQVEPPGTCPRGRSRLGPARVWSTGAAVLSPVAHRELGSSDLGLGLWVACGSVLQNTGGTPAETLMAT